MKRLSLVTVLALVLVAAFGVQSASGGNGPPDGVASHIIVYNDGVDSSSATADLARRHGLGVSFVYGHAISGAAAVVPQGRLRALERDPRVAYVEPNQRVSLLEQPAPTGIKRVFADGNPNITIDGNDDKWIDADIAILDTGIDLDHPNLNVFKSANCARRGPRNTSCKEGGGNDGHGHGTHVSGTAAGLDNGVNVSGVAVVGVAPGARLWGVKVLDDNGSGFLSWLVGGLDYVTANAGAVEVANMSLGYPNWSQAMVDALTNSVAAGVTHVVAAGNDNQDASVSFPANHPDVITVSAIADYDGEPGGLAASDCWGSDYSSAGADDERASFSNFGSLVEIAAPGVCIVSAYKDGGYAIMSGTSMSSPHVTGAAALLSASGFTGPSNILSTLLATGNNGWSDNSGDGSQEPLLDVSDQTVYNPSTVAPSGDGGDDGGGGGGKCSPGKQKQGKC